MAGGKQGIFMFRFKDITNSSDHLKAPIPTVALASGIG